MPFSTPTIGGHDSATVRKFLMKSGAYRRDEDAQSLGQTKAAEQPSRLCDESSQLCEREPPAHRLDFG
jgi:hypothetical protein